mmetsp:Transcript_121502/g.330038  ORF Transcript_121502/g.330038 Transcript_121502/m.330038 type:complete len:243 (+) Transcript_121502:1283-2011(+)
MPTIFSLCFAFLSINSSSGRFSGKSGALRTTVWKMTWHFSHTQDFTSSPGRCLPTKSRSFWHKSVYISVYWCCLLDASKTSASRSSRTCLNSWSVTVLSSVSLGSVSSSCSHSFSNFSGVNLLISDLHCCWGPAFCFRAANAPLERSFFGSSPCFRDLASPSLLLHEPSSESRPPRLVPSLAFDLHESFDLHDVRPPVSLAALELEFSSRCDSEPPDACGSATSRWSSCGVLLFPRRYSGPR